ncbi:MAG: DUF3313 family protein [Gammaproteobacteria bacterium]|nr:DUF3313 family protein [Gammaproteobacteria bacterium]
MKGGIQIIINIIIFLASILALSSVMAMDEPYARTHDNLKLVKCSNFDLAYLLPDADLGKYNKIILQEADITFKKNWKRHRNQTRRFDPITDKDMESIISKGKDLFEQVFTDVMEKGGYSIVTKPGEDVLLARPYIFDLDITAPDLMSPGRITTFTESAGSAKLFLELYDSITGQILFQSFDKKRARWTDIKWAMPTNSVTNRAEAIRGLKYWAGLLRDDLDNAKGNNAKNN